jgi:hypothetical protein
LGDDERRRLARLIEKRSCRIEDLSQWRLVHFEYLKAGFLCLISLGVNHKESSDGGHIDGGLSAERIDMLNHVIAIR